MMNDESTGLNERRARTIVVCVLIAETVWVFLARYLPLDAGLWALQAELVRHHLAGHAQDGWQLIPYPASNIGAPIFSALFTTIFPGEVVVRLLLTLGAIFARGMGMLTLFRVLRVRDAAIYFLIPVLVMTGLWFSGAVPHLMAETLALWVLVYFLSQDHPRSSAYWMLSIGLMFVSLLSGLVFLLMIVAIIMIMLEQRRSVHLSQGWLNEPRSVMSLLALGTLVLILGFLSGEPVLRLSATGFLPTGLSRMLFLLTPAPRVLEATFRYGDILHALVTLLFILVLLGCFARAYLLAIEEVTWQSRAVRSAGYVLLLLAILGPLFSDFGIESSSGVVLAVTFILAGAYSRGPAVRRNPIDRLLYTCTVIVVVASIGMNGFSIVKGSAAALEVIHATRSLVAGERETTREDEHLNHIGVRFVMDSALAAQATLVGTLSYTSTAPLYLFSEGDVLGDPAAFQPPGGAIKTKNRGWLTISPVIPIELGSEDKYIDSTVRILAALPMGTFASNSFGPFELSLVEDAGIDVDKGEAKYRLAIGKLRAGHPIQLAQAEK
jgi:hypothetical protein